jgi:hypothetical protein
MSCARTAQQGVDSRLLFPMARVTGDVAVCVASSAARSPSGDTNGGRARAGGSGAAAAGLCCCFWFL